ncbi:MAG: Fur family transcriptional regulator [Planctomycetota bacterium]
MIEKGERDKFTLFLKGKGLRLTKERERVLREVFARHDHFDAEQLSIKLRKGQPPVSRATVYRTLELLVSSGLVQTVNIRDGGRHYEHIFGHQHHDHMICVVCGTVQEFSNDMIEKLQDEECRKLGFRPSSHKLEIRGTCSNCKA